MGFVSSQGRYIPLHRCGPTGVLPRPVEPGKRLNQPTDCRTVPKHIYTLQNDNAGTKRMFATCTTLSVMKLDQRRSHSNYPNTLFCEAVYRGKGSEIKFSRNTSQPISRMFEHVANIWASAASETVPWDAFSALNHI